jgi:hypothetical protein
MAAVTCEVLQSAGTGYSYVHTMDICAYRRLFFAKCGGACDYKERYHHGQPTPTPARFTVRDHRLDHMQLLTIMAYVLWGRP